MIPTGSRWLRHYLDLPMPARNQKRSRRKLRRNKKHALATSVVSSRIIFLTLLRKTKHLFIYGLVTCLLVLACWGIFYTAKKLITGGERFQLDSIVIAPEPDGMSYFNYQNIPEITGLQVNDSIFSHSLNEIEEILEAYPELKKATLAREFPGTIKISLEERDVVAKLNYRGKTYMVDSTGYCFLPRLSNPELTSSLPVIEPLHKSDLPFSLESKQIQGVGLERSLALSIQWQDNVIMGEEIVKVKVKDLHSLLVTTRSGMELTYGYYEHERQLQDFNTILHYANTKGLLIKRANLLPFENIPIVFDESKRLPKKIEVAPPPKKKINTDLMKILNQG